ncbi:arabinan endo-1,5-alpha-L-arabinosidase [Aeoliella mucimassa]|uniref:Intracellular endo-alpha-(1->5)-L-arabinanase n=1 Tax=Aeoliella mucimassa TaxID=2527972 RepID=A0A518ANE1_9BACT|nr:arabinan endo-1,5-alpha-L-arabinosidase [Aeoliella mucimassa]QDU56233.1 Intracellular endo-alpha-(1->5)-L-arabinanase [Aeoliella mucimassa]
MNRIVPKVVLLLLASVLSCTASAQRFAREGILAGAADPTIVAVENKQGQTEYYVVATGRGVRLYKSTDLKKWKYLGRVFENNVPEWARRAVPGSNGIWAPDLSYHNGLYYMYYSVSTFGSQRSVIGLAVNKAIDPESPDYKWEDRGLVIESSPETTNFNAIDPALLVDEQGRWLLYWGSFWTGLKVVEVDPATGKPKPDAEIQPIAARPNHPAHAIEAAYVIFHDGYYYLFVSWDSCCDGADSTYRVLVGRSREATGPFVDADGKPMLEGGGTLVIESSERWRGPGHNCVLTTDEGQWMVHHTYDMQNLRAQRILQIRPMTWTEQGWPKVGEPVATP